MNQDGRRLVIVENYKVTYAENINGYNRIKADVFRKLLKQTKQQAEYLAELASRMKVISGDCNSSRLDYPIEELHPKIIIWFCNKNKPANCWLLFWRNLFVVL